MKTIRIEDIKDTLKKSQMLTKSFKDMNGAGGITGMDKDEIIIEEVVKEYEKEEPGEDEAVDINEEDEDEESTHNEDDEDEDDGDDGMDNGMEEVDPQVLKL